MSKVKRSKEPLVVYWNINTEVNLQHRALLLNGTFKSVMKDITKRRLRNPAKPTSNYHDPRSLGDGSYHFCPALQNLADNMFYIPVPFDVDIALNEDGSMQSHKWLGFFAERGQTMDDAFNLDVDYEFNVFCEEPLEMTVTPPYLHRTDLYRYGFISAVKWDISKWFRPITPVIQLWPGVRELKLTKDDPLLYVSFDTDRPIVFKQARYTQRMRDIYKACGEHKFYFKFIPLQAMYDKFVNQGLKNDLLREFKENIIKESDV